MGVIKSADGYLPACNLTEGCSITVASDPTTGVVVVSIYNREGLEVNRFLMPVSDSGLHIEAKVSNSLAVDCSNTLTIIGVVELAEAQNCMDIEGTVGQASARNRVFTSPNLTVEYGKKAYQKHFPTPPFPEYKTPTILRIESSCLSLLKVAVTNVSCETVVRGYVKHAVSGNHLSVRGKVLQAQAGNCIEVSQKSVSSARMGMTDGSLKTKVRKVSAGK